MLEEGEVAAGDAIAILERDKHEVKVSEITMLYAHDYHDIDGLRRVVALEPFAKVWRDYFRKRLAKLSSASKAKQ